MLRFLLRLTVQNSVIRVPLKRYARKTPRHPFIQGVMQKQVRQQRRDDSALWCPLAPWCLVALLILSGSFEPPLNVEHYPLLLGLLAHCPHHQVMGNVVEKAFDIQIQNPIIPPASLPGSSHRLLRGLERPVSV